MWRAIGLLAVALLAAPASAQQVPATGSATLNWTPPTANDDGSPLTDLAGFRVYWGKTSTGAPENFTSSATIQNKLARSYAVAGLVAGDWRFAVTAIAAVESDFSNIASKTICCEPIDPPPGPGTPVPGPVRNASMVITDAPAQLVTGLSPSKYRLGTLAIGAPVLVDRSNVWTDVSTLAGAQYILTGNDDKQSAIAVSFTLSAAAIVYVARDPRIAVAPWLSAWLDTGTFVMLNDDSEPRRKLYRKAFPAGAVVLGTNGATSGASAMYSVIVVPQ